VLFWHKNFNVGEFGLVPWVLWSQEGKARSRENLNLRTRELGFMVLQWQGHKVKTLRGGGSLVGSTFPSIPHPYYIPFLVISDLAFGCSLNNPGVLCRGRGVGFCCKEFLLGRPNQYVTFSCF
jgi:hypothetical protein